MNIKEVKDLIHEILQSDITEFELEHTGTKIKIQRARARLSRSDRTIPPPALTQIEGLIPSPAGTVVQPPPAAPESSDSGLHVVASPIVGTFYRAPSPGAEAYVKIGDMVEEGTTLCIVEAMKLMNEIPSDVSGKIERIYVENGHPVEYGQQLFGIRTGK